MSIENKQATSFRLSQKDLERLTQIQTATGLDKTTSVSKAINLLSVVVEAQANNEPIKIGNKEVIFVI